MSVVGCVIARAAMVAAEGVTGSGNTMDVINSSGCASGAGGGGCNVETLLSLLREVIALGAVFNVSRLT